MPMKNILVALDGTPASDRALEAAVTIQRTYGAHLTGYVAISDRTHTAGAESSWLPAAIRKTIRGAIEVAESDVTRRFRNLTQELPPDRIHLVEGAPASDTSVAEASRFFDVTLVGIPGSDAPRGLHPDRIALLSGRPVVAFPAGAAAGRVATRIMVAWDGSRAAARALGSAMRLIDPDDTVTVVTIGEPARARPDAPGLDPETALTRQGLQATWARVPLKGGVAQTLLAQADTLGADVIVMGAFEHSKFREDLFGGVTHDVMAATRIPVFLAH
jgi:nucleotide-binding universal stress UspA family protein